MGLPLGSRWSWAVWAVYLLSPFVLGFGPPVVSIHDTYSAPLTYTWQEPLKRTSLVFPSKSRASKRQTQKSQGTLRCDAISYFSDHSPMDSSAPNRLDPQQPIYNVAPLRSMPYIGPPTMHPPSTMPTKDSDATEKVKPAMIFLPSLSTKEERDNILATTKSGVALTGAAALGQVGPIVGLVDIGECKESYLFRVSVPGVSRDESFSCTIEDDGEVSIKGITTTGEQIVCKDSQVFQMQSQNLCPPGHFSISFQLPGSVDPEQFIGSFETDGIFEGIVKKLKDN